MSTGSKTSEEAGGVALVLLAFALAIKYPGTAPVKIFVRGWEMFVPGLVWVPILYCTIAFGTWKETEADLYWQRTYTLCGLGISCKGGMNTSTHPTMRSYEGDDMQDSEESKESKAEANLISPRRHDYGDRKKRRKQRADEAIT
jgi:hypothetical protein